MQMNTYKQPLAAIGLGLLATATSVGAQERSVGSDLATATAATSSTANTRLEFQWGDFDADGLEDAIVIPANRRLQLLRNLGDGSFEDFTTQAGLDGIAGARFALWQDFDKDGLKDLFIGTDSGPSHLLHNAGTIFVDVTLQSGITSEGFDRSAHWVDYDSDGVLDLHLIQGAANTLYHGLAVGGFEPIELPALYSENEAAGVASGAPGAAPGSTAIGTTGEDTSRRGELSRTTSTTIRERNAFNLSGAPGSSTSSAAAASNNILACVQSLRDMNGGSCIQASRQPTLGMLYPMSTSFFVTPAGDVGIGTIAPDTKLHIPFGDDAGAGANASNGFLMLGEAGAGQANVVIDNNEVMARLGGDASKLHLNADGGDVAIGGLGGATLARLGIGTITPSTLLDVNGQFRADGDAIGGYTELLDAGGVRVKSGIDAGGGYNLLSDGAGVRVRSGIDAGGGYNLLSDGTGVRVTTSIDSFGGTFVLTDDTGVSNAFVADINSAGGKMDLRNNLNVNQVNLGIDAQGGFLVMKDTTGAANAFVADIDGFGGKMDLRDANNVNQVRAALQTTGGYLVLGNGGGTTRSYSGINAADNGFMELSGFNSNQSVIMGGITGPNHATGYVQTWYGGFPVVVNSNMTTGPDEGAVAVYNSGIRTILLDGGNGAISGTSKAFIQPHPTDATQQIRYISLEGPEHGVYFRGTADVINGIAQIEVPESFRLVADSEGLTVNVTPLGPTRGLYVSHKGLDYITVQEMPDGFGQLSFDYQVMGVRSALDELEPFEANVNFIAKPGLQVDIEGLPGNYGELMVQNGTLLPNGTVNEQTAALLGWSFDGERWSHPTFPESSKAAESQEVSDPGSSDSGSERGMESHSSPSTRTPETSQRKEGGARTTVPNLEVKRRK